MERRQFVKGGLAALALLAATGCDLGKHKESDEKPVIRKTDDSNDSLRLYTKPLDECYPIDSVAKGFQKDQPLYRMKPKPGAFDFCYHKRELGRILEEDGPRFDTVPLMETVVWKDGNDENKNVFFANNKSDEDYKIAKTALVVGYLFKEQIRGTVPVYKMAPKENTGNVLAFGDEQLKDLKAKGLTQKGLLGFAVPSESGDKK